jgi:hypothetical protein
VGDRRADGGNLSLRPELADPDGDWSYDEADHAVVLADDAIPPRGATVRAEYVVAPSSASGEE